MTLENLVSNYIISAEEVFEQMSVTDVCINAGVEEIEEIVKSAKDYLKDAIYYRECGRLEISLTSIAYCEGLLDALRMLGAVKFNWPTKRGKAKRKR